MSFVQSINRLSFRFRAAALLVLAMSSLVSAAGPGAVGDLYVPSGDTHSVKQFDGISGAAAGTFVPTASGGLNNPAGIAFGPSGNLFVTSYNNDQVIQYDGNTGALVGTFGIGGGLDGPYSIAFGPDGNLYACSFLNARIVKFDGASGAPLGTFASGGGLGSPIDLTFGPGGDLYVSSSSGTKVLRYDGVTGAFVSTFASGGGLSGIGGLAFGPNGNLFVASFNNNQVIQYDGTTGAAIGVFASGGGLSGPFGITYGSDGNLYVGSYNNNKVVRFSGTNGAFIDTFVATVTKPGHLRFKQASGPFPPPNVTGFTPNTAANCGPTQATITGTGFATGIGLKLKRAGQADISGAIQSITPDTQVVASFNLAGAALGLWDVEARYPDNQSSMLVGVLDVTLCSPPTVTGFAPNSASNCGPLSGATISGSGFLAGATVKLSRTGQSDIAGTSVVVIPPGTITANFATTGAAPGAWDVTVTNPGGSGTHTLTGGLQINACPPPSVSGINPNAATNCGALTGATISGGNFLAGATVKLSRSGQGDIVGTSVVVTPPGTITASFATTGAAPGAWDVTVTNPGGSGSQTLAGALNISACPPPVVTAFSPTTAENCATLSNATITGSAFLSGATVKLTKGGQTDIVGTSVSVQSATTIQATFALNGAAAGFWSVAVTNPGGSGSSTLANAVNLTICPAPTIISFAPTQATNCRPMNWSGNQFQGVSVVGTGFRSGLTALLRQSGQPDLVASGISGISPTGFQLLFQQVTGAAPGDWDLIVTNPDGQSATLPSALQLTACPSLVLTGVQPPGALNSATNQAITVSANAPIYGTTPSTLTLHHTGSPDIVASANFNIPNNVPGDPVVATVNLNGAATGFYDVTLTRADGSSNTLLAAFDVVEDPGLTPTVLGTWGGAVNTVFVDPANPSVAYIGSGRRLVILDVSLPIPENGPLEIGSVDLENTILDLKVRDGYAYVATYSQPNFFCVVDVHNLTAPARIWSYTGDSNYKAAEVDLWNNRAFVRGGPSSGDVDEFNIINPANPIKVGKVIQSNAAESEVVGNFYYHIDQTKHVRIYDLSVPWATRPFVDDSKFLQVGNATLPGSPVVGRAIAIGGNNVYAATRNDSTGHGVFAVVDAASIVTPDPNDQPAVVYSSTDFNFVSDIAVSGGYAFVADSENFASGVNPAPPDNGRGLAIYDIASNPANPALVGTYRTHGIVQNVAVVGATAYVMNGEGIEIVDVSNPAVPLGRGRYHSPSSVKNVTQDGDLLYVTDSLFGFTVVNVADPRHPRVVGTYQTPLTGSHHNSWEVLVDKQRNVAFLAAGYYGLYAVDVSDPTHPTTISNGDANSDSLPDGLPFMPGTFNIARALAISGARLQVGVQTLADGLFFNIDTTDPAAMVQDGAPGQTSLGATTICNRPDGMAIAACSSNGTSAIPLKVLDNLQQPPSVIASPGHESPDIAPIGSAGRFFAAIDHTFETTWGGLWIYDLANPSAPAPVSHFAARGTTGVAVTGIRAYLSGGSDVAGGVSNFSVVDISSLSSPVEIAKRYVSTAFRVRTDPRGLALLTTVDCGLVILDIREGPPGDCNNDGFLDMADATMFTDDLLNGGSAFAADMNADGKLDGKDIQPFVTALMNAAPSNTPHGACCGNDGVCHDNVTPFNCQVDFGGTYQGNNTTCAGTTCPASGACCIPYGNQLCLTRTQAACLAAGGTYQGDGVACETSDCVPGVYKNEIDPVTTYVLASTAGRIADDMTLGGGTGGRELNYLDLAVYGGNVGQDFDVTVNLYTGCPGAGGTIIPGASWQWFAVPDDGSFYVLTVDPVAPGITLPDTVWMEAEFSTTQSGWIVANQAEIGTTQDLYARNNPWICNATVSTAYAGLWANLRCNPGGGGGGGGLMAPPNGGQGSPDLDATVWDVSASSVRSAPQGSTPGARIRRSSAKPMQLRPVTVESENPSKQNSGEATQHPGAEALHKQTISRVAEW